MKKYIYKKLSLAALAACAFLATGTLQAVHHKNELPISLEAATLRLKAAAKDITDPHVRKLVKEALKKADAVTKAGSAATSAMAKKALQAVNGVLVLANQKKKQHYSHSHHYSHSSSESSCEVCREIKEMESDLEERCEDIKQQITKIIKVIDSRFPSNADMVINQVPVVITAPGKYRVSSDLVYSGSNAAITVAADNVTINFYNHSLTLTNSNAQGILARDVSEFTLENDIIQGETLFKSAASASVHLVGVNKAKLDNIYTKNTTKGVWIEDSNDVRVEFSHFQNHECTDLSPASPVAVAATGNGGGVFIAGSSGVTVDACTFEQAIYEYDESLLNVGFHVEGESENIILTNSTFTNWLSSINILKVDGLLIDHCLVFSSIHSDNHFLQLGSCEEGNEANDVIIRNSSFTGSGDEPLEFDGLLLISGSGCLIENVIVHSPSTSGDGYSPAAVHVGLPECGFYENVSVKNSTIAGPCIICVFFDNCANVTVEGCHISDGDINVSLVNATSCTIKDCTIAGGGTGVHFATDNKNALVNCQIYGNDTGIYIDDTAGHSITGNRVYNNESGIEDTSGSARVFYNTSCNNSSQDCINIITEQTTGSTAKVGSTICCDAT